MAQHRVLVPEHKQLSVFRPVAAEHLDSQAEYPARRQVDDLEQHPASQPSVDPGPHRLSRLPAGQLLRPRQDRHQRQPRRRPATTAPDPGRGRELPYPQPLARPIPDLHRQRPRALTRVSGRDLRSGSGQATACTHMTYPILRPGRGGRTTAGQIMTGTTTQTWQVGRRVVN